MGNTLNKAFFVMDEVEYFAKISYMARQLGGEQELSCDDLAKLMELRVKMQIPGRHPGCKKCPNLGTEKCKCKQNLPAAGASAPKTVDADLVAEITRRVMAELNK